MFNKNCYSCRFYTSFTVAEKEYIVSALDQAGFVLHPNGCCSHPYLTKPTLIRRFVYRPVNECVYWQGGVFEEKTDVMCPICKTGQLVLRRIPRQGKTEIVVGCSNYPKCKYTTSKIITNLGCKICNTPYTLQVGKFILLSCNTCNQKHKLPLSLWSKPYLFKPDTLCLHNLTLENCSTCKETVSRAKNLVEIEALDAAKRFRYIMSELDSAWDYTLDKKVNYAQSSIQDEDVYVSYENNDTSKAHEKTIKGVLGRVLQKYIYTDDDHQQYEDEEFRYYILIGLKPRDANSLSAKYNYSEYELQATLFTEEVDQNAERGGISAGYYLEKVLLDEKAPITITFTKYLNKYALGKVILKYFELAFSATIKEHYRAEDENNYDEEDLLSDDSNTDVDEEYYLDDQDEHEDETREERTQTMDEYVTLNDTGWFED